MSKHGGPAFPTSNGGSPDDGMTLRDYFAAKAMQGDIAGLSRHLHQYDGNELRIKAEAAYLMADAMLKARNA